MGVGRDLHGVRKNGTEFPVEIGLTPVTTQEGLLVIATIVDITERKQSEHLLKDKNEELKAMSQQLWQAAKLATMGELAASIAHELNNPLATVSLRTEMLAGQFDPGDPEAKSLRIIDSEVKRMSVLVANLLQFSRQSGAQISTINVNEELTNTLELVQYHLRKNAILTVQELSPDLPMVQADRQQLRQVFLNLFTNAADAMSRGGMLVIRTWAGEEPEAGITAPLRPAAAQALGLPVADTPQVFIEVSDSGEGITPETLQRVWEPFYTTKPEGKGTGLGLAICRRIVQEHGGTIELISDGVPGKGTTVRLSLPAVKGQ
jgi:signal transduction histidine kinase